MLHHQFSSDEYVPLFSADTSAQGECYIINLAVLKMSHCSEETLSF